MSDHTNHFPPKTKPYISIFDGRVGANSFLDWIGEVKYAFK